MSEIKHFVDSLILDVYPLWRRGYGDGCRLKVVDVGSGAGFPGIPLRIVNESMRLYIIEATAKRVAFLRELVRELSLSETEVVCARAEQAGQDRAFRDVFDWALVRGVAAMPVLLEYCLPLLRTGGHMAAYKGPGGADEIERGRRAARVLGGKLVDVLEDVLPEDMGERRILIYEKISPTPSKYPRNPGIPSKQPLL